jgi:hypothetical protein
MSDVEKAVKKFRDSPSPVIMTPAEHLALCEHYGAIKPNDYENPFMGKVIQIREPQFAGLESDVYESPIDTFIPPEEEEPHFIPPLADDLDELTVPELPSEYDDEDQEIPEDPYA